LASPRPITASTSSSAKKESSALDAITISSAKKESSALDAITIIAVCLEKPDRDAWIRAARFIFATENLRYRVDDPGGVHYNPDEAFERVRVAAIGALQPKRYANAAEAIDQAHKALDERPLNGKGAVRSIFEAAEIAHHSNAPSGAPVRLL
jgi:hypothetical protein